LQLAHPGGWVSVETTIEMAPCTKDRRYIRVEQPFEEFVRWMDGAIETIPGDAAHLASEVKVKPSEFFSNHDSELLGKPRSNLFIESVGARVRYWYIVESSNQTMKCAYQAAYAAALQ
jgi:hypothetical protein